MKKFIACKIVDILMSRHVTLIHKLFGTKLNWLFAWAVKEDRKHWTLVTLPGGSVLVQKI